MRNPSVSSSPFAEAPERVEIERELEAGEKLLWFGRPHPADWKRDAAKNWNFKFFISLFALFWMGLAAQPLIQTAKYGRWPGFDELIFPVVGLAFFGGAVYQEWFKPLRLQGEAARTFYAVTDRRALVVATGKTREVRSFAPHQIQLGRREREHGRGDVLFNDARSYEREPPIRSFQLHKSEKDEADKEVETGFFAIENPREVERLIRTHLLKDAP